jgi:hypothetical protein
MGWHLYLRDYRPFRPNKNGSWGWQRRVRENSQVMSLLASIGITITGDGTCDHDGIADLAGKYPIKGRKAGGRLRGCIEVNVDEYGRIEMANQPLHRNGTPGGF